MYKSPLALRLRDIFEELQNLRIKRGRMMAEASYEELEGLNTIEKTLEDEIAQLRRRQEREDEHLVVEPENIAEIVAMWTGIPLIQLVQAESQRLLAMEQELQKKIVGQDEAIASIAQAVRRARAGLKDPHRPIGLPSSSWGRPASENGNWRKRLPVSSSETRKLRSFNWTCPSSWSGHTSRGGRAHLSGLRGVRRGRPVVRSHPARRPYSIIVLRRDREGPFLTPSTC
jgi:hypothetical protein